MLRWFPRLQVTTACFSCSPPNLDFLDPYLIFMYMHYNYCHRATTHLQLNILLLLCQCLQLRRESSGRCTKYRKSSCAAYDIVDSNKRRVLKPKHKICVINMIIIFNTKNVVYKFTGVNETAH